VQIVNCAATVTKQPITLGSPIHLTGVYPEQELSKRLFETSFSARKRGFFIFMTQDRATLRQAIEEERYEAYHDWERQQLNDPRFTVMRLMRDDARHRSEVSPETWERFDVEERTWAAEVIHAPHSHVDRFYFDGRDVIVKEADGVHPAITLRSVYEGGLRKSRADAEQDPDLEFQVDRDELFMRFYEEIEKMLRGETAHDTIHMVSTCPVPEELSDDPVEALRLMRAKFYDPERAKSFDYTARRLPDGRLELSATTLDNSNLTAHAKVLQAYGYQNVAFNLQKSHGYGQYLSYENTTHVPIEMVIAARVSIYDAEMEAQTGLRHRYGRQDDSIDAHDFFRTHCEDYWAAYKAYSELLAKHLAGQQLERPLQIYLLKCLDGQQQAEQSVLSLPQLERLRSQLWAGRVTLDMALGCRELLVYDHHATMTRLMKEFRETGQVTQLASHSGAELLRAYADTASSNGAAAAANGETFAGCETATGVNSLTTAARAAGEQGLSLEQSLRLQEEEALHCLRIQRQGYTIRHTVECPFCDQKVDARDTQATIECLNKSCRTVLNKATGETWSLLDTEEAPAEPEIEPVTRMSRIRLHAGRIYRVGNGNYRRELHTVVGGARLLYVDEQGQHIIGRAAERLEAAIVDRLAAESRAA